MSNIDRNNAMADQMKGTMFNAMDGASAEVAKWSDKAEQMQKDGTSLSETDMMQFNMAVARYNTMTTLTSSLVKNLTEGEKGIASKM